LSCRPPEGRAARLFQWENRTPGFRRHPLFCRSQSRFAAIGGPSRSIQLFLRSQASHCARMHRTNGEVAERRKQLHSPVPGTHSLKSASN
jgi:hypothetical protein